jgi:cytidine deaminase
MFLTIFLSFLFNFANITHNNECEINKNLNEISKIKDSICEVKLKKSFEEDVAYLKNLKNNLSESDLKNLKNWNKDEHEIVRQINVSTNINPNNLSKEIKITLLKEAARARTFAYCPYSNFHVGAAVLLKNGKIYSGCNFENAAFGNTICAERSAIAKAISENNRGRSIVENQDIIAVAIVLRSKSGSPCGNCRQSLYEFNPNMLVLMSDMQVDDYQEKYLHELLPIGFGPVCLDEAKVK